jgi:hypothetical protein
MPATIVNAGLYADRTVQDWHRETFSRDAWAIDLDLMGACHRCRDPLYLIEATTNPNKPVTILRKLAERANVAALIIFHDTHRVTGGRMIWPVSSTLWDASTLSANLLNIRRTHVCT